MTTIFKTTLSIFFGIVFIAGCTTTTTTTKNPVFGVPAEQLQTELNKLVSCENINLDGREVKTNGKSDSELEVDVVNGRNIPADDDQMISLGKLIASNKKDH